MTTLTPWYRDTPPWDSPVLCETGAMAVVDLLALASLEPGANASTFTLEKSFPEPREAGRGRLLRSSACLWSALAGCNAAARVQTVKRLASGSHRAYPC
ncbi:hypothetical protein CRUP_013231 [Coryphaenoides rupestris]|nr:hypothetical protein CRUP_013231 [Coryphaenoides rupestris]